MAVRIRFDAQHNAEQPTLVLATKNGRLLGKLPAHNMQFKDTMNSYSELRFDVYKKDCIKDKGVVNTVSVKPISVHNVIASDTGYTRIGQITAEKVYELIQYYKISEKLSNSLLKLVVNSETKKYKGLKFTQEDDFSSLYISDSNDRQMLKIQSDGNVYIYNAGTLGLAVDDAVMVELSFDVPLSLVNNKFWEQIKDFKLAWAREWNILFEVYVELNEADETIKNISAKSLGEVELSQIKLYNIEINTETDIEREDYEPTIVFDEGNAETSLLNRIMEKAPHYRIRHVDSSIANLQRTFEFNNTTIYDAFQRIAEEVDCLFVIRCYLDADGKVVREINVYDLESNCLECNHRGEFSDVCPECGSNNIKVGYGENTTIFVSTENLANNITYSTDEGSVKNCFRLEAGDDLMTATLVNCNPNGSGYIWYVSDDMKEDMSEELVKRLNEYDEIYDYYYREHKMEIEATVLSAYNALVEKYQAFTTDYKKVSSPITGYPALMQELYNTIDFYLYLNNSLMPSVEISRTTAALQAAKLNTANLSPVAVQNVDICSSATATSAVLAMAKTLIDSRYQVKVKESLLDELTWAGSFTVTSYSDEEDTATTGTIYVNITGNYEEFVKQKIEKVLSKSNDEATDIVSLFKLDEVQFKNELKKYSLVRLTSFNDCCQSCLDLLIEQGIADKETWANKDPDLYRDLYTPYYNKLRWIQEEIKVREAEISVIIGVYDKDGDLSTHGLQTLLEDERSLIQDTLDFEKYLGEELWLEFVSYRREDTYQNNNYISDGLNNAELFQHALEFIETAKKEIFKSATLQHSISATLKNLLVMKEFSPIVDHFEIGNWLRCKVDGKLNLLRLLSYEINFNDLDNLSVTFSDVKMVKDGVSDVESILNQASSMATSYGAVMKQASKGKKSNEQLNDWVNKGLALTKMKIIDSADNQNITWDSHGLLCKEYLPITDSYDEKQLKLINRGLYLTDDNWLTSRAGIGNFAFYNPETGKFEEAYGVIADTLVGNLVLSEKVGVYNTKNSITLGENGVIITTDNTGADTNQMAFTIQKKSLDVDGNEIITPTMYIDSDGNVVLHGTVRINSSKDTSVSTLDDLADVNRFTEKISNQVYEEIHGENGVYSTIDAKFETVQSYAQSILNDYKAEIGQYMNYDENGLTLGATSSAFKTVIDNQGMYFKQGDAIVSYVNNSQLYIPNAVIEQNLILGGFFFSSRTDGGVSVTWQGID